MEFDQLWNAMKVKNPNLSGDAAKVTITAASFRSALKQAYDIGKSSQQQTIDRLERAVNKKPVSSSFGDIFGESFGKKN